MDFHFYRMGGHFFPILVLTTLSTHNPIIRFKSFKHSFRKYLLRTRDLASNAYPKSPMKIIEQESQSLAVKNTHYNDFIKAALVSLLSNSNYIHILFQFFYPYICRFFNSLGWNLWRPDPVTGSEKRQILVPSEQSGH